MFAMNLHMFKLMYLYVILLKIVSALWFKRVHSQMLQIDTQPKLNVHSFAVRLNYPEMDLFCSTSIFTVSESDCDTIAPLFS